MKGTYNGGSTTVDGIVRAMNEATSNGHDPTLAAYLGAVRGYLTRYIAFPSEYQPVAVALWTAHTHLIHRFDVSPILAITSAEMRSGKTLVFDCLEFIVAHPERMVTPSPAATYTAMSQDPRPTLLLDEADAIFTKRRKGDADTEGLRAVFNAGNRRGQTVARVEMQGKRRVLERLDVYGAKAIAGIGSLPETITDRSIVIRMRRKAPGDEVQRFRLRKVRELAATIRAPEWSSVPLVPEVPDIPGPINDRAQDSWEPLLAIADAAGGIWPSLARSTAVSLSSGGAGEDVSEGVRMLHDIRDVMGTTDYLTTTELLHALHEMEEAPWGDYYGKPLAARRLARILEPYDIHPRQERVGEDQKPRRCYFRSDFLDAWIRYLPAVGPESSGTSGTAGTADEQPPLPDEPFGAELANDDYIPEASDGLPF